MEETLEGNLVDTPVEVQMFPGTMLHSDLLFILIGNTGCGVELNP